MMGHMQGQDGARPLELLAIQRMGRLRPSEKRAVLALLDDGLSLSALVTADVEAAVGRRFRDPRPDYRGATLLAAAERDVRTLRRLGARFLSLDDPDFPPALREIADAPFGLYLRGTDLPGHLPSIAVVGTRHPTGAGLAAARDLGIDFSDAGIPVVSGLAIGIDSAAHRGALVGGGRTCAVLPCGVDATYPACNRGLASTILEAGGLLASEYPPGTPIVKSAFPERNRIIAGLCRGLVVVEAPEGSGALISADFCLEGGRDVFVAASRLGGPRSAGLDRLAAEGARPVAGAADILGEWGLSSSREARFAGLSRSMEARGAFDQTGEAAWTGTSMAGATAGAALAQALRAELGLERAMYSSGN